MGGKTYEGRFLREISFPLGGIGADSIGLAGNGRLIDREIFNRPNRQSVNGYTNFAIKAERDGEVLDAIQGNIAVLKSYTCMRLTKGEFYAFEYAAAFNMLMHATENEALELQREERRLAGVAVADEGTPDINELVSAAKKDNREDGSDEK